MKRNRSEFFSANQRHNTRGFNIVTPSLNLLLLGLLLVAVLRIVPSYMEYLTVRDLIKRAAAEHDPASESVTDLRVRLGKLMNTNQIRDIRIDDIEVYRAQGVIVIDANYEKRFPLFWILDGVIVFDDLVVETRPRARA